MNDNSHQIQIVNHIALLFEEVNDKEIQLRNSLRDQGICFECRILFALSKKYL